MKVLLYAGHFSWIARSGVGKAFLHQKQALKLAGVPYTTDKTDTSCDIVHINTIFPSSLWLAKKARKAGKKIVYHAHSTQEDFRNSFLFSNLVAPLFKKWISYCYQTGDFIITPTPYAKKLLESYPIHRPICALSNGIDLDYFNRDKADGNAFRQKYGIQEGQKVVISVGLFLERKGILDFVEAAKRFPQYQFIWFGYTDLYTIPAKIRQAVQTKLPNLTFAGYVSADALRDAYAGCDLYWFPTHEETEGIVLLEALAMQTPTLVRDIPIYEDWLEEGKHVYKGKTLDDFCNQIEAILEGRVPNITQAGYTIAQERSIQTIGKKLSEIYTTLLV